MRSEETRTLRLEFPQNMFNCLWQCFPKFFPRGTPKIIFHIMRKPCLWKRLQRGSWWRTEMASVFSIAEKNFPQHFKEYLLYFAVFKSFHVFISRFPAKTLQMLFWTPRFCGNLVVKYWRVGYMENVLFWHYANCALLWISIVTNRL